MSDRQQLAEHGTSFCVAALGIAAGGVGAVAIPVAILTTIGLEKWAACDARTLQRAKSAAEDALVHSGEISAADMSIANSLLKESRHKITFDPVAMANAVTIGDLPDRLLQAIFGQGGLNGHSAGTKAAITTTLTAAFNIFRGTDAYQAAFTQEMVMALLASKKGEIEIISETLGNTRLILDHLRQSDEYRRLRDAGITEHALVDLARRIAADVPDAASAFRELENAVEIAIRVQAEGRMASNHGDFVDTVLARVAELARDGRYDAASADIDAALTQEQAESAARTIRLLDAGIEQDTLRRNAPAVADRLLRKAQVEGRGGFKELRAVFMEWYERGRDKGLNFDLAVSIALAHRTHSQATTHDQRGTALVDLGIALQTLGDRESGTARLEQAVAAFDAALEVSTRDRVPLDWAISQINLGNVLQILGQRESGTARLEQAVAAYSAALEEWTRDRVPLDWAISQMNLGSALQRLGERESGTARLEQAVAAFRAALEERTRDRVSLDWAVTQMNLGNALQILGQRESGTARLEQAVVAYGAALKERTRDRVPLQWARTQMNLGTALTTLGQRESGTAQLEQAVAAYGAALEEWTRDRVPLDWANAMGNHGLALLVLADRTRDLAMAQQALDQLRLAEDVLREGGHARWAAHYADQIPIAEALVAALADGTT